MSIEQNKAIVHRYYEEVGIGRDLALADQIIAPEFKLFPDSQPPYGAEGVKQFMGWLFGLFPDLYITYEELVAEGDTVAVRVTLHATHVNDWNWGMDEGSVAPTGKKFAMREYVFWRVVDGRIVERSIVIDSLEALRQLGVSVKLG